MLNLDKFICIKIHEANLIGISFVYEVVVERWIEVLLP